MLITHWADRTLPGSWQPTVRFMINGRAWPHTERFTFTQGDTVRWRVINATGITHPMHLHGFHFEVIARGDSWREDVFPQDERRLSVTENLLPSESIRLAFVASEPGNWIFHCHLMRHMSWVQNAALEQEPDMHSHAGGAGDALGGLVIGMTVKSRTAPAPAADVQRRLALHITQQPRTFGDAPGYGFVLQEGERAPAADSVHFPGSTLLLTRGEPTEIVVHNHADVALGVHWHGLELESRADGVPGWSGDPAAPIAPIAPGDSFAVRITPPRAGTFMYHVHSEPGHQLAQGLYGPFLVTRQGEPWDSATDRLFLLGSLGATLDPPPALNGTTTPEPLQLRAGTAYRLRFMHISPDDEKRVALLHGDTAVTWTRLAKDGADLPPSLVQPVPASLRIDVGETYDFEWTPAPGDYTLRIITTFPTGPAGFVRPEAPPPHTMDVPVRVR
jgi:FtsP/CotA-like multicopper oxidase with cupredoxin domain